MRRISWLVLVSFLAPFGAFAERTIDSGNFAYQGCIKAPVSLEIAGMTFYPDGDPGGPSDGYPGSLYLMHSGGSGDQQAMEMSIPIPSVEGSSGNCPNATILRGLRNVGCNLDSMANEDISGGIAYYNDVGGVGKKLYWTVFEFYNVEATNHDSAGWMDLDLTGCEGAWGMTGTGGENPDGDSEPYHSMQWEDYIFEINDKAWADTHLGGRYLLYGRHREAGARGSATGINLYAAAPWNDGNPIPNNGNMNGQIVLAYSGTWALPDSHYFPALFGDIEYRPTDRYTGGSWVRVGTEDAIVITGRKGLGPDWYGDGGNGCNGWRAYHDDPYEPRWWFYDPTDLECVIAGTCKSWDPVPYASYNPANEVYNDTCFNDVPWQGGTAFDDANDLFYFAEDVWNGSGFDPVIHVYRVNGSSSDYNLTVNKAGTGSGTVTSSPSGIDCGVDCQEVYSLGTNVQLAALPNSGSYFAGWSGDGDCDDGTVVLTSDRTCTATFEPGAPPTFTLSLTIAGTGSGTVTSSPAGIDCGGDCQEDYNQGTVVQLAATPGTSSVFGGWGGAADCNDGTVTLSTGVSCVASFALQGAGVTDFCPGYEDSTLYRPRLRQVNANSSNWISVIEGATSGDEILLADGIYHLEQYAVQVSTDITIRSASGNRNSVLIEGQGYAVPSEGFMILAPNVTLADLSMTGMRNHAISIKGEQGADAIHVYNVHLYDVGTQHIKGTPDSQDGIIACSKIGYTPGGVQGDYINAIGIHGATDYVIRDNEIYNIWGDGSGCEVDIDCGTYQPGGGPSIHIWNHASGNVLERNRILDSFRGIALGFGTDHAGGAVRNNFFFQSSGQQNGVSGDAGISIEGSNILIDHNTVILGTNYRGAIEVLNSSNLQIRNNLLSEPIWNRGNATYNAQGNKTDATTTDLATPGNPHLDPNSEAVDFPASVNVPSVDDDIDGDPRPQGDRPDAGCDELVTDEPPASHTLTVARLGSGSGTVTSSPAGINCGSDCAENYDEGTVVQLTANPAAGSEFTGWSGDADCDDGQLTMNGARSCNATFVPLAPTQHTVTVARLGSGSGTVTSSPAGINCGSDCAENYDEGTVVQLTANPAAGSEFTGWSGDADCDDGQLTMNGARSCNATFIPLAPTQHTLTVARLGSGSGTVTSAPAGINCGSDCAESYDDGTAVQLTATPDDGSIFAAWSGDSDCEDGAVTLRGDLACTAAFEPDNPFESKIVPGTSSSRWKKAKLRRTYQSMVAVCNPEYNRNLPPLAVRIRNAVRDSLEVKLERLDGETDSISGVKALCTVIEAGNYPASQYGVNIEAVRFTSTLTDRADSWAAEARDYTLHFDNPVVLGQVMTANDERFSVFWSRGVTVADPPDGTDLWVGKHVAEDPDFNREAEEIGYVVIEAGRGTLGGTAFEAGVGAPTVRGFGDHPPYSYALAGDAPHPHAAVSIAGMKSPNGGWVALYDDNSVSPFVLQLAVDEDQLRDLERSHEPESIAYLIFEPAVSELFWDGFESGDLSDWPSVVP